MNPAEWRPLPWQAGLWESIRSSMRTERLAHALLLAGPPGTGKRHFVHGLSAALLCETPQPDAYPCGHCRSCLQWAAGHHPNLTRLQPEEGKRDITIESVRGLIERLSLSSHYGMRKLAIVDPADALNVSSVNALLKTIEEPPPASHILLVTERLMSLAPTLRSRCQIVRCPVPAEPDAERWLAQRHPDIDAEERRKWLRAPLRLGQALGDETLERRAKWTQMARDATQGRLAVALKSLERIPREHAEDFLRWMLEEGTRSLRGQLTGAGEGALQAIPPSALQALLPETVDGLRRLAGNANPQLLLESLMIRMAQMRHQEGSGEQTR